MPQEFQTLRCYNCEKFQVHQTKKATKWQCKVCGQKQFLKKAYFIGSARDCRLNVQQLNFEDGEQKQNVMIEQGDECSENFEESSVENENHTLESEFSSEHFQSFEAPTLHHHIIPKKKARYETDPSFETVGESQNVLSILFPEDVNTNSLFDESRSNPNTSTYEEKISFDVNFDLNSPSSTVSELAMVNNKVTGVLKSKNDHCSNVEALLPRKRLAATKNRGFQLILNAAKKLT